MLDFIAEGILWTLAIYGFIEITKTIYYTFTYNDIKLNKAHIIITVKDEEDEIEGFMRLVIPHILNDKKQYFEDIIIADLNSKDRTKEILSKLNYKNVRIIDWEECKEIIDNVYKN